MSIRDEGKTHHFGDDCPGGHRAACVAGVDWDDQETAAEANARDACPPGSILRIEGDGDIRTVMAGLDSLTVYGETRAQRQAAYDLLLRLRCRMGSDGRWRQGLPGDVGTVAS